MGGACHNEDFNMGRTRTSTLDSWCGGSKNQTSRVVEMTPKKPARLGSKHSFGEEWPIPPV
eukprot:3462745-Prorocentrum_lima.AAC.1